MKIIRMAGPIRPSTIQIPGWAGGETVNGIQPWTIKAIADAFLTGWEIYWDESGSIEKLGNMSVWNSTVEIETPKNFNIFILPHQDPDAPKALLASWQTDWFPCPLPIYFVGELQKDKPVAQIILTPRDEYIVTSISKEDKKRRNEEMKNIKDTYTTRDNNWYPIYARYRKEQVNRLRLM